MYKAECSVCHPLFLSWFFFSFFFFFIIPREDSGKREKLKVTFLLKHHTCSLFMWRNFYCHFISFGVSPMPLKAFFFFFFKVKFYDWPLISLNQSDVILSFLISEMIVGKGMQTVQWMGSVPVVPYTFAQLIIWRDCIFNWDRIFLWMLVE